MHPQSTPDLLVLAYLAGAIDSDGHISIKRSTYGRRVRGDTVNATYHEQLGLRQVTPAVPDLLKQTFGGSLYQARPQTANSKRLWGWQTTHLAAATACAALRPYLRIKHRQAEMVLELRASKGRHYLQAAYWFAREFPDWPALPLVTRAEAARLLGYTHTASLSQAIRHGTLLALPYDHTGRSSPAIPLLLVQRVAAQMKGRDGRVRLHPPQLVAWRERLWDATRLLNTIGETGTPITHRTGPYTPRS